MSETPASLAAAAMPKGPGPGGNVPEFSVSEISAALKRVVEGEFAHVRVRGEISGFKRAASGHLYMTLKDENAVLDAVCWRGTSGRLGVAPEDGMEVIATGRLTTYAGRSKYQIVIEALELAGEGALLKLLEERRKKLAAEGLFDAERKRKPPYLPDVIGVVTSPTGAVIRDILHRLADRFPRHVLLWPVLVQGDGAAEQVARAIEGFNGLAGGGPVPRPDLLIVARGGGSLEDLWAFNEEVVVRAAAASDIPLISAVGHETDTTLIDYASDLRAPTPTAAAEMAVPVRADLAELMLDHGKRLYGGLTRRLEELRLRVEGLARGLPAPRSLLETRTQQLDDRAERLRLAGQGVLRAKRQRVETLSAGLRPANLRKLATDASANLARAAERFPVLMERLLGAFSDRLTGVSALLESYSYERVLDRGFALVRDAAGAPVTGIGPVETGAEIGVRLRDGELDATVTKTRTGAGGGAPRTGSQPKKPAANLKSEPKSDAATSDKKDDPQGSLL